MENYDLKPKKSTFKQNQNIVTYEKTYNKDGRPDRYPKRTLVPTDDYTYECILSMPLLNQNDSFYIEEDDKYMYVRQVIRTSKDNVIYYCYDNNISDEKEHSRLLEELEEEINQWDKQKEEMDKAELKEVIQIEDRIGFGKFIINKLLRK